MVYCPQKAILPWLQQCSLGLHKNVFEIENTVVIEFRISNEGTINSSYYCLAALQKIIQLLV